MVHTDTYRQALRQQIKSYVEDELSSHETAARIGGSPDGGRRAALAVWCTRMVSHLSSHDLFDNGSNIQVPVAHGWMRTP